MSIADVVIIIVVFASVIAGIFRGFVKTFVGLVSLILAFALSFILVKPLTGPVTDWVYSSFLKKKVENALKTGAPSETAFIMRCLTLRAPLLQGISDTISSSDLAKMSNVEWVLRRLDPNVIKDLDPDEMQRLVDFLCSPVCRNHTLSACFKAYNKKYGTNLDMTAVLKDMIISGNTKVPAIISTAKLKFNVAKPLAVVQADNAAAAAAKASAAEAASKAAAASRKAASKAAAAKTGSSANTTKNSAAVSRPTSSPSSATASPASSATASSKAAQAGMSASSKALPASSRTSQASSMTSSELDLSRYDKYGSGLDISSAVETTVRSLASKAVSCVLFVLLFIIIRLILTLAAKFLTSIIDKVPVVRGINKALGGAMGLVNGLIISVLLCVLFIAPSEILDTAAQLAPEGKFTKTVAYYDKTLENSRLCSLVNRYVFGSATAPDPENLFGDSDASSSENADLFAGIEEDVSGAEASEGGESLQ